MMKESQKVMMSKYFNDNRNVLIASMRTEHEKYLVQVIAMIDDETVNYYINGQLNQEVKCDFQPILEKIQASGEINEIAELVDNAIIVDLHIKLNAIEQQELLIDKKGVH